jgi:hypothetical protein
MAKKAKRSEWQASLEPRIPNPESMYFFGGGKADGNRNMKDLLGGKGSASPR